MDIALPLGALALSGVVMPFTGIGSQGRPRRAHSFTVRRMYFNFNTLIVPPYHHPNLRMSFLYRCNRISQSINMANQ